MGHRTDLTRRLERLACSVVALALACLALLALMAPMREVLLRFVPDDAFYYFEIARRMGHGEGSTFDGIHQTNGYHPLWLFVLVPLTALAGESRELIVRLAMILGIGMMGGAFWLIGRTARSTVHGSSFLAMLIPASILTFGSSYGVESPLAALLLAVCLWRVADPAAREGSEAGLVLGLTSGLAVLARLDAAVFILAMDLVWVWWLVRAAPRDRSVAEWKAWLLCVSMQVGLVGSYMLVNDWLFSLPLPISAALKIARSGEPSLSWMRSAMSCAGLVSAGLGLVALIVCRWRRERSALAVDSAALGSVGFMILVLLKGGPETYHWYFVLPVLCSGLFVSVLLDGMSPIFSKSTGVVAARVTAVAISVALLGVSVGRRLMIPSDFEEHYQRAVWIAGNAPEGTIFADTDCGILGFFSGHPFVNTDGLTNSLGFQRAIEQDRAAEWLSEAGVNAVVLAPGELVVEGADGTVRKRIAFRAGLNGATPRAHAVLSRQEGAGDETTYRLWTIKRIESGEMPARQGGSRQLEDRGVPREASLSGRPDRSLGLPGGRSSDA